MIRHARCEGFGWFWKWCWNEHTHVLERRKYHCRACKRTGYVRAKPIKPLPDAARVRTSLQRRKNWQDGDELSVVNVSMGGAEQPRLGLYRLGALVALVRETRAGAVCLDDPPAGCGYRKEE